MPRNISRFSYWIIWLGLFCGASATLGASAKLEASAGAEPNNEFLAKHWPDKIAPQGAAPTHWTEIEKSLSPQDCASCHPAQYSDWQNSQHSKSMGPGITGQLVEMFDTDPATADLCLSCHAPLSEQQNIHFVPGQGWTPNPLFKPEMQQHGMMCASCHVREHQRFGPPRLASPNQLGRIGETMPHGGFIAEQAFEASEFCKGCHQFSQDDYRLNNKLIEDTYAQWKASRYAAQGVQCQNCHMPERKHLWRGIHDREMTASGISIETILHGDDESLIEATIRIANTGTGHHFPTYITPKVFVKGRLLVNGVAITQSEQVYTIGWESFDLATETYDTRLAVDEVISISYQFPRMTGVTHLEVEVVVDPDHWYRRFYENMLMNGSAGKGEEAIRQAHTESSQSSFTIYSQRFAL